MTPLKIAVAILYLFALNRPKACASPRVYYVDDSNAKVRGAGIGFDNVDPFEQSSRDLDLSFSSGDTNYPAEEAVAPISRRVDLVPRPYAVNQDRQYIELGREADNHPRAYYKLIEVPERRSRLEDVIFEPKQKPKFNQFDRERKGEVILELRVITNNDAF